MLQNRFYDIPGALEFIKERLKIFDFNARVSENIHFINSWWFKIGDLIVAHPDYCTKIKGKTSQNTFEFMLSIQESFGCIVNAHLHRVNKQIHFHKLLIENPCLCHRMDYILDGHKNNAEWYKGYSDIVIDKNGKTDFNRSDFKIL